MYTLITILIFLASVLLVLIVLVQNSKGGGLASNFSASNQVMGVRKTTDFLEKATWTLIVAISLLCISSAGFITTSDDVVAEQSMIKEEVSKAVAIDPNLTSPKFNNEAPAAAKATAETPATAPAAKSEAPAPAEKK